MKTMGFFPGQAGERVTIKTKPNADILGYYILVDQWKGSPSTFVKWNGTEAEGAQGVAFDLEPADGYDVTIKAEVKKDAAPKIAVTLATDSLSKAYDVEFPSSEGPVVSRDWNIFLH